MKYRLLYLSMRLLSCIPFCVLYILSDLLYYLLYYIVRYRRHIARRNLTESFPERPLNEIKHIEKSFYQHFADLLVESVKMCSMSEDEIRHRMHFKNVEEVNAAMRRGKSIAVYMGHYANWEWCVSLPLFLDKGAKSAQIYHKLSNKNMDRLMLHIRERMGSKCVEMRKTARYVLELASEHENCVIGFIADQAPRKKDIHHYIPFLNHNTPVLTGTEKLVKHFGFETYFLHIKKIKRGYYIAEFIKLHDSPQSLPDFKLTDIYFQQLEKCIMERPELYLWTHNRFRSAQIMEKKNEIKIKD